MSSNSDNDPLASVAKGATEGGLNYLEDKIKGLINKFRNKELVFIQDDETIQIVKTQLKSGEWSLCEKYVNNNDYRILIKMGLTLRQLSKNKDLKNLESLRGKIHNNYGAKGLHIAQFVQEKIFSELIANLAPNVTSVPDFVQSIEDFLNEIEKFVMFVKYEDDENRLFNAIRTRLDANVPRMFIIFSSLSAVEKGLKLFELIKKEISDYKITTIKEEDRLLIFLVKRG